MKYTGRIIAVAVVISLLAVGLYSHCNLIRSSQKPAYISIDSGYRQVMGTFARIIAVGTDEKNCRQAISAAMKKIRTVDELMSDYKENSEISTVNRLAYRKPVKMSKDTFEVIKKSIEFAELTDGAFDITIAPVVELWRSAEKTGSPPTARRLEQARSKVGFNKLLLDEKNKTVKFKVKGVKIDLGGIAKGYAVDKAIQTIRKKHLAGGMVDIGGDIKCFGKPDKNRNKWTVGIQDPKKAQNWPAGNDISLALELTDMAVATSGNYRRFYIIKGRKHPHIINTGKDNTEKTPASVTIIASKAADADALATAVSVMDNKKAMKLIEQIENTEALIINPSRKQEIIKTPGAHKFIK